MTVQESVILEDELDIELELEETLSLCDLPLYSDQSADWDQDFSLNSISTSSSSQQDYFDFEFSSQELNVSAAAAFFPPENLVFCGKLIPYNQLSPCKATDSPNQVQINKTNRWQWKLSSRKSKRQSVSVQSKNGNKSTTACMHQPRKKTTYNNTKQQLGKAKWYFFLFGISRFSPAVVELSDIRSRQRRSPPLSPPPPFRVRNCGDDKVSSDGGSGLWRLIIRALSCGSNHLPTAAAVTGGGAPPE